MKKKNILSFGLVAAFAVALISCNGSSSAPSVSLKNDVDSISYAYGVNLADQGGLIQFLEQNGVMESTTNIRYEYEMRIAAADSTDKPALQKEMKTKIDSLNKANAPKLNAFIKGLKAAINSNNESDDAYTQGLSIGHQISKNMMPQFAQGVLGSEDAKVNNNQFLSGLISSLKSQKTAISTSEANLLIQAKSEENQAKAQAKRDEELKVQYTENVKEGEEFLAENGKREGVVTLPSGLQYEIIKEGTGDIPTSSDQVKVHYHGTLIDGEVFDSSVERGEPAQFGVTQVISGWTEALQLMPVGSKWKLYIPADLAYGSRDTGSIKPFSTLIFDVELLDIVK